ARHTPLPYTTHFRSRVLDQELPETPYTLDIFSSKVLLVFDHVLTAYGDDGESAYTPRIDFQWPAQSEEYDGPDGPRDVDKIADRSGEHASELQSRFE